LAARERANSKKIYFLSEPKGLVQLRLHPGLAGRIEKLERFLTWPEQPGYKPPPFIPPLAAGEQKEFDAGRHLFTLTCAACHHPDGLGAPGIAPPLVDSEWVLGSEERLVRLVLQGAQGPIKAAGVSFDSSMPSWASFSDEQIAAILTYIRRDWEQGAFPIKPETIKAIREASAKHSGAWTEEELSKIP
jgi:mono/diheme cytochrome c family protein